MGCLTALILLLGGFFWVGVSSTAVMPEPIEETIIEATPTATPPAATGGNFTPATQTIWNAEPGKDRTEGTCGEEMVNYCAHMVAISPQGEDLSYRGMEIQPYTLKRLSADRYVYSGRNMLDDGIIELTLTFTSQTEYTLKQVLVLDANPTCRHLNTFTGTFMR